MSTFAGHQTRLQVLEDFFAAEPSAPRASLPTVVSLFIALSIVQVGTLGLVVIAFDPTGIRAALYFVIAAPAPLYAIIAAWDCRQLSAAGQRQPVPWALALVFPPAYLLLRWMRVARYSRGRTRAAAALFGRALVQIAVAAPLAVVLFIGVVISPVLPADAADVGISAEESARLLTADGIESAIRSDWAELGTTGSVACPPVLVTTPGTEVTCRANYQLQPIQFTIVMTEPVPGARPWQVKSWTNGS